MTIPSTTISSSGRDATGFDVPTVLLSPGGRWLVVRMHLGWHKSEVWLSDLAGGSGWVPVAVGSEARREPVPLDDVLYLMTNEGAPRYRLFEVDYTATERAHWKEVIPEGDDVLVDVAVVGGAQRTLVASYLHEASARIERFAPDGTALGPSPCRPWARRASQDRRTETRCSSS